MIYFFFIVGLEFFHIFLRSEFSEENLDFWIECEAYKGVYDRNVLLSLSQKIFRNYFEEGAPKEVRYSFT